MNRKVRTLAVGWVVMLLAGLPEIAAAAEPATLSIVRAGVNIEADPDGKWLDSDPPPVLHVGDRIDIVFQDEAAAGKIGDCPSTDPLSLYLDGMPVKGLATVNSVRSGKATFFLQRTDESRELWLSLYRRSHFFSKPGAPEVSIGVGCFKGPEWRVVAAPTGAKPPAAGASSAGSGPLAVERSGDHAKVRLSMLSSTRAGAWLLGMLVFAAVLFGTLAKGLLRDSAPPASQVSAALPALLPYSLSKTQLLFWFIAVIVVSSYIGMVTGQLPTLSPQVLGLIGVSAGTSIVSRAIEAQRDATPRSSKTWLSDVLSDQSDKLDVTRFQALIVTAVLGTYFLWQGFVNLLLPELDANWVLLMGVSSATYLSFKLPDVKK